MEESNLNDLTVFVQVVDSGSFTAAAQRLGTPPSTVSRRVARLERRLGARLLHRTTRRLRLTESGQSYFERGSRILEELEDAEREVAQLQGHPRGRVRIAAPMEQSVTTPLISRFLQKHGDVRIELFLTNRSIDLIEEGYDISIQPGELPDSTHLIAFKLMDSALRLVASPKYLAANGVPETPKDLAAHDCIIFGPTTEAVWSLLGGQGAVDISVRGRFAVNHMLGVKHAAVSGLGIAMLPSVICSSDVHAGVLKDVLADTPPPAVPIWITYLSGRHISPAVRAFVDFAKEQFLPLMEDQYPTSSLPGGAD